MDITVSQDIHVKTYLHRNVGPNNHVKVMMIERATASYKEDIIIPVAARQVAT